MGKAEGVTCGFLRMKWCHMKEQKDLCLNSIMYFILRTLLLDKTQHFHSTLLYIPNQLKLHKRIFVSEAVIVSADEGRLVGLRYTCCLHMCLAGT